MNKLRGICHIEIGGKLRGMAFNMNCYAIFCEGMDIDIDKIDKVFSGRSQAKALSWLMYSAVLAYDEKHRVEIDYDVHDFYDWVMDVDQEQVDVMMSTMIRSRETKNDDNNGLKRNVVESTKDDSKKN